MESSQGENENRPANIQIVLFYLYILRVHIVKSHKSFLRILASKPGLHQDKHCFGSSLNRREERH